MVDDKQILFNLKNQLTEALLTVDRLKVNQILNAETSDYSISQLIEQLVVPAMEEIGHGWETGEYSLSQVYMSGRVCEEVVDKILPPMHETRRYQPKSAIVVLEDYHLLGKRIVYSVLRASGYELANYGRMDTDELAARVEKDGIEVLFISVLMLPSALRIKNLSEQLRLRGSNVKIVVGGAPFRFDPLLWQEVGADAAGGSATEAVEIMKRLVEETA